MRTVDLILRKRGGEELSVEEIQYLINGYTTGEIPDYQMSAFLMATFFTGMTDRELSSFTEVMMASGEVLNLADIPGVKVDKHSTGGVGDKTSLICAPIAAAAGVVVPMISGRGLGHTGGTLDKLESIPGFRTDLTLDQFRAQLAQLGLAFIGQSEEIAPADKRLYALRDVTGTVESIPLIASSIMSKKMAEGVDALVLDVKVGNGAFMKKQVDARRLAQAMVGIGRRLDKKVQALITDMNQPLGFAVGNALEVMEVSQTLQKAGPADLTRLSLELAARMIHLGKVTATLDEARKLAEDKLMDGSAYRQIQAGGGGAGRQSPGARPLRTAAERHRHARDSFAARRFRERDHGGRYRPRFVHDGRGPQPQGRCDRSRGGRDSRSEGRRKSGIGLGALPPLLHLGRESGRSGRTGGRRLPHFGCASGGAGIDPRGRQLA